MRTHDNGLFARLGASTLAMTVTLYICAVICAVAGWRLVAGFFGFWATFFLLLQVARKGI